MLILLTLFLRPQVAFCVYWHPISPPALFFHGAVWLFAQYHQLFGFILVLGIVVDDAIVTGENIYTSTQGRIRFSCIEGDQEIALPVTFGVLTPWLHLRPYLSVPLGKFFAQIPAVVIPSYYFHSSNRNRFCQHTSSGQVNRRTKRVTAGLAFISIDFKCDLHWGETIKHSTLIRHCLKFLQLFNAIYRHAFNTCNIDYTGLDAIHFSQSSQ